MKEMIGFLVLFTLAMGFLWGFSTGDSPYVAERTNYYQAQVSQANSQETRDAWESLALAGPASTNCLGLDNPFPRPTRIAWMGASEPAVIEWARRNEMACLDDFERQMRMISNDAGLAAAHQARSTLI